MAEVEVMPVAEHERAIADAEADVTEALDAIDDYAAKDLDHELHSIVEHYRGALGVRPEPPNPDAPAEPSGTPSRGRNV